jgi:hypothetical protein
VVDTISVTFVIKTEVGKVPEPEEGVLAVAEETEEAGEAETEASIAEPSTLVEEPASPKIEEIKPVTRTESCYGRCIFSD